MIFGRVFSVTVREEFEVFKPSTEGVFDHSFGLHQVGEVSSSSDNEDESQDRGLGLSKLGDPPQFELVSPLLQEGKDIEDGGLELTEKSGQGSFVGFAPASGVRRRTTVSDREDSSPQPPTWNLEDIGDRTSSIS